MNVGAGGITWTKIGATNNYILGISGDSCMVTTTISCLPASNSLILGNGTYSYASPTVGTTVQMIGAASGITSGRIVQCNVTLVVEGITVSNLAQASYPSQLGDSGAGIFSGDALSSTAFYCYGTQSCTSFDSNGNWVASFFHQFV